MTTETFAKLLQFSISPIALISGASLLLLSITNRLGRTIDRSRILVRELEGGAELPSKEDHKIQLKILLARSHYLRAAVLSISTSILLSVFMIVGVTAQIFMGWEFKTFVLVCLSCSVLALGGAVVLLFADVSAGLHALTIEVRRHI